MKNVVARVSTNHKYHFEIIDTDEHGEGWDGAETVRYLVGSFHGSEGELRAKFDYDLPSMKITDLYDDVLNTKLINALIRSEKAGGEIVHLRISPRELGQNINLVDQDYWVDLSQGMGVTA